MVKHLLRNSKFSRHTLMLRCYTSYMRKMLIELVLLIWLITGVVVQPAMAQAEEWVINQFQSDITIQSTGIVLVEETIAVLGQMEHRRCCLDWYIPLVARYIPVQLIVFRPSL